MSKNDQLSWRETYFVLFPQSDRPTMAQVEAAVNEANPRMKVENLEANSDGLFASCLIQAPEDNAAVEISYEFGDMVVEQSADFAKKMRSRLDGDQLAQLLRADARLDIMHFERVPEGMDDEFAEDLDDEEALLAEALDPATLITVVDALAKLTGGLAIDPASEDIMI